MPSRSQNRKTTPKVRDGQVQKKNRHAPTRLNSLSIGVGGSGGRLVTTKEDVWRFLRLIPDWKRVSADLDLIYLDADISDDADGWYEYPDRPSIVLSAFDEDLRIYPGKHYYGQHEALFRRLGVAILEDEQGDPVCQFDEASARAFQLLHIFLHELGHHHYRITKGRGRFAGDEAYAERYALKMERVIWKRYQQAFDFQPGSG
ncbi:MAG: hypothetical protein AAGA96_12375 [Verrucomicrobiota bacterium]